jgi:hypothetical protein
VGLTRDELFVLVLAVLLIVAIVYVGMRVVADHTDDWGL